MNSSRSHGFVPPWQWGIIRRRVCRGLFLETNSSEYEPMTAIYEALKNTGFKETYWQFVYPDQVGGLVKIRRHTLIEFHVRFFKGGMIYAEMEFGRSVFLHFLNKRCYINSYIIKTLSSRLSALHIDYLRASTKRYKRVYHNGWPEWTRRNRFMTPKTKMQIRFFTILSDWRTLALIMLASVASSLERVTAALPLLTAIMIVIYLLAPRRT
jgi:hypothetical protein